MDREKGFGLIEVIIASAVLLGLLLGIAGMYSFTGKAVKSLAGTNEFNGLVTNIGTVLNTPTSCTNAFAGRAFNPAALPVNVLPLVVNGVTIVPAAGSTYGGIRITQFDFDTVLQDLGPQQGNLNAYLVRGRLFAVKLGEIVGSATPTPADFTATVVIDATNTIVRCE